MDHTSTLAFSVDSELLHSFPGRAGPFQILLYHVWRLSSSLVVFQAFCLYRLHSSVQAVCCRSSQNVPEPSQSSFFYDEIYRLQLFLLRPEPLIAD